MKLGRKKNANIIELGGHLTLEVHSDPTGGGHEPMKIRLELSEEAIAAMQGWNYKDGGKVVISGEYVALTIGLRR